MVKHPFISIILICYNYAHLLSKALDAIANQTFRDFELIFVDNASTDNSLNVVEEFCSSNPEIAVKIVHIDVNKGVPHGEECGLKFACGEYLMFHDADDWMDPDTLELLSSAAISTGADRVVGAFRDINTDGKIMQVQELGENPNCWMYAMQQANLYRTSIYKNNDIQSKTMWIDVEKMIKFAHYSKNTAFVRKPCYNYLVHSNSTSRVKNVCKRYLNEDLFSFERLLNECLPYLPKEDDSDRTISVYALTKCYFGTLFLAVKSASLKETMQLYNLLNGLMKKYLPSYLKDTSSALKIKKMNRPYTYHIMKLSYFLERTQLMKPGLFMYHFLSKIHHFNA